MFFLAFATRTLLLLSPQRLNFCVGISILCCSKWGFCFSLLSLSILIIVRCSTSKRMVTILVHVYISLNIHQSKRTRFCFNSIRVSLRFQTLLELERRAQTHGLSVNAYIDFIGNGLIIASNTNRDPVEKGDKTVMSATMSKYQKWGRICKRKRPKYRCFYTAGGNYRNSYCQRW